MVEMKVAYNGQLRCRLTHGPSGAEIQTDAPVDNHGRGEAFSPTDLCSASLAACMLTVMGIAAQSRDVDMSGASAKVGKEMSAEPPRRIARITIELSIPLPADHPQRAVLEAAGMSCPVHQSLHPDIEKVISWNWTG